MVATPSAIASQEENLLQKARRSISKLVILRRQYLNLIKELAPQTNKRLAGCAAMLIDYIRHWQEWKLENHRTPWLYQPLKFICEDLMAYSMHTVRAGIALLEKLGLLQKRCNPGNYQDKTYQYNILFDRVKGLIDRLGITDEVEAETPAQSPFVSPESSNFSPESSNFSPESSNFTVEKHQQLLSTDSSTAVSASLSEESEKKVKNPQEEDVSNLITKVPSYSQKQGTNYVEKIELEKSQEQKVSGEDQCSAPCDVNQSKTPRKVQQVKPSYYLNGFNSQEERNGFYEALMELGKQKADVRSPVGWACNIIKDINAGGVCEYLNEYRRGEPLGMCEKQEWENASGQIYPRFLQFLKVRLKLNQMSGEQAIQAAHRALRDTNQAKEHWESFKRTIVNFAEQWKRDKALGLSGAYVPPELLPNAEIAIEEAAQAMQILQASSIQEKLLAPVPTSHPEALPPVSEPEAEVVEESIELEAELEVPSAETVAQWRKTWNSKAGIAVRSMIAGWVERTNGAVIITDDGPVLKSELVAEDDLSQPSEQDPINDPYCQGKFYKYAGDDYSIQKICKANLLTVIAINGDIATVSCEKWAESITQDIPFADLKEMESR